MIKTIFFILGLILALVTSELFYLHYSRVEPSSYTVNDQTFTIKKVTEGESTCFLLLNPDGTVADSSLCGSTDLFCSPPRIIRFDMNNDGLDDLYIHECGGHGYLTFDGTTHKLVFIDLGQYDKSDIVARPAFLFEMLASGSTLFYALISAIASVCAFTVAIFLKKRKKNLS